MEKVSAKTRFGGLLGRGISYSLSPLIHNISAEILGLDCVYLAFDMAEAPSAAFFESLLHANCFGFNVTVPYKETIAKTLSGGRLTTCNTLIPKGTEWQIESTDAEGFLRGLAADGIDVADMECFVLLGYGGAAKAIVARLRESFPQTPIKVLRRKSENPLPAGVDSLGFEPSVLDAILADFPRSLLIQASSAETETLLPFAPSLTRLKGAFSDLVYSRPSVLLNAARTLGLPAQDGLPMLIHQALLAQELWWGQSAPADELQKRLEPHLGSH